MPDRLRVLVREPIAEPGVELLRGRFDVDVDGDSDLAETIAGYDAIVIRSATKLTADVIARADRLKVIGRAGVGVDNVDVDAATHRGIVVANAPDSTVVSAAEQTIGLLVALARNIPQAHAAMKRGTWERSRWSGIELADKTLGVLGLGRIGQQVARRAVGLGMRVVAYDPFVGEDRFREAGIDREPTLEGVLGAADFVTLHLPLTDETAGIIGREAIASMRDGARLINAARGALVDEDALVEAIRSGKLAGAALDVFSTEPYSGPLLELDEVVVTPHLAASTDEAQDRAGLIVAEQIVAALEGGLVTNAVNIPVVDAADLEMLGPFIPLAAKLGRLAVELEGEWPKRVVVAAHGPLSEYDTRLLTVAALNGIFQGRVDQAVNYVNAPVIAAERGIAVSEERFRASRDYMNLVEVAHRRRRRLRDDDRPGAAPLPGRRARLLDRHRARAEPRLPTLYGHARRDRHGGDDVRRARREHREHGRLANPRGRQGADGVRDRRARPGRAGRAHPRRGLRRRAVHLTGMRDEAVTEAWPDPVERVSEALRTAGAEARIEEFAAGTPTAEAAAAAVGCELGRIVKSLLFDCDGSWVLVLVPGDRRADAAKVRARDLVEPGPRRRRRAGPRRHGLRRRRGRPGRARPRLAHPARPADPERGDAVGGRGLAEAHGGAAGVRARAGRRGPSWSTSQRTRNISEKRRPMQETEKIWMNGELVDWADARIHVAAHGLHYGTGVFEGIRCYATERGPAVFRLVDHLTGSTVRAG